MNRPSGHFLHARVEVSYELENNIIYTNNELTLAPWQNFQQKMKRHIEFEKIYTDGFKAEKGVGYSAISWYKRSVKRLPNQELVYSAEDTAIYDAGKDRLERFILTDSIHNKNPLIQRIIKDLHDDGGRLRLNWIPAHSVGHRGILKNRQTKHTKNTHSLPSTEGYKSPGEPNAYLDLMQQKL
jgi:hypothetical protein